MEVSKPEGTWVGGANMQAARVDGQVLRDDGKLQKITA
jgi:hypothetical protein